MRDIKRRFVRASLIVLSVAGFVSSQQITLGQDQPDGAGGAAPRGGTIQFANNGGGVNAPVVNAATGARLPAGSNFLAQLYAGTAANNLQVVPVASGFS